MNRRIDPRSPILLATLAIRWDAPDPIAAIARLEQSLLGFSPSFLRHECRGPRAYHVFLGGDRPAAAGPGEPALPAESAVPPGLDGRLALAHLIEHAVIDFLCAITEEKRCSGVTGVHRGDPGRFDLMVECPDGRAGRLCLALAVATISAAVDGHPPGPIEQDILLAARLAHGRPLAPLNPPAVARSLGWVECRAGRALEGLRQLGYLFESRYSLNLSGVREYRVPES